MVGLFDENEPECGLRSKMGKGPIRAVWGAAAVFVWLWSCTYGQTTSGDGLMGYQKGSPFMPSVKARGAMFLCH